MDAFVAERGAMASVFDVVELSDGECVAFGELAMLAVATVHTPAPPRSPLARRARTPGPAARAAWCWRTCPGR